MRPDRCSRKDTESLSSVWSRSRPRRSVCPGRDKFDARGGGGRVGSVLEPRCFSSWRRRRVERRSASVSLAYRLCLVNGSAGGGFRGVRRDVRELESSIGAWTARGVLCAVSPGGEKNVIKKFETQLGDLSSKLTSGGGDASAVEGLCLYGKAI